MKLIACGGRDYYEQERIFAALDALHAKRPISLLAHGGAWGADQMASRWAESRGVACKIFAADWERYRKAAGPIRNQQMLDDMQPDGVIAFPGGRGTLDMVTRAEQAGIQVWKPYG